MSRWELYSVVAVGVSAEMSSIKRFPVLLRVARYPVPLMIPLVWYSCLERHFLTELIRGPDTWRLLGETKRGKPEAVKAISHDGLSCS